MTWLVAALSVAAALYGIRLLRIPSRSGAVFARVSQALAIARDEALEDIEKERAMRRHALAFAGDALLLSFLTAVALGFGLVVAGAFALAGVVVFDEVLECTVSWPLLVGGVVLAIAMLVPRAAR